MDFSQLEGLSALDIFRLIAPEFDLVSNEDVEKKIKFASIFVCRDDYGDAYNAALAMMTAHMMALPGGVNGGYSTSSGKVTAMKEGDLSISYGSLSSDDSWLGQTTYGGLLSILRKTLGLHLALMTRGPIIGNVGDYRVQN